MNAITIRIRPTPSDNDGRYYFDIYKGDAVEEAYTNSLEPISYETAICTTTLQDALEMARDKVTELIRKEKGEECPGCGVDMLKYGSVLSLFSLLAICEGCGEAEVEEGDFIGSR
jgi:hypothetical protein